MSADAPTTGRIAACVKWVDLHPEIDSLHGTVTPSEHGWGFSPADSAALEVAIRVGRVRGAEVVLVCAGPARAEKSLRTLAASGADRVVRVDQPAGVSSATTAAALSAVLGAADLDASVVVCGDLSYDRGSGAVPALLAHHLQHAQALGLTEVDANGDAITAVRRLDGARRERLSVRKPAVLSVEGSVASLRRAPLSATMGRAPQASSPEIERRSGRPDPPNVRPPRMRPWRPRARVLPAPGGTHALDRVLELTGATVGRTPPRTVTAEPVQAADLIIEQLRIWGYLAEPAPVDGQLPRPAGARP